MTTKKRKRDGKTKNHQKDDTVLEDRISELPDCIIICILSHLPTIAAIRTGLLSQRWRHMWTMASAVDIEFPRDNKYVRRRDKVLNFVDNSLNLKNRCHGTNITRFKLIMSFDGGNDRIDRWLQFLGLKNLEELDLCFKEPIRPCLPNPVLHLKKLAVLNLNGLALKTLVPVNLPSLRALSLFDVRIEDHMLNNMLPGCPLLESLVLKNCDGLYGPKVTSPSLKRMTFGHGDLKPRCREIKVDAMNLESFVYYGGDHGIGSCNVNLLECLVIRSLTLEKVRLDQRCLNDVVPQLSFLETLRLNKCYGMKSIQIQNQNLRSFFYDFNGYLDPEEATMETPRLERFHFTSLSMMKLSVKAPNLLKIKIKIPDKPTILYDREWYVSLIKFLSELNECKFADITCPSKEALIIPDELRNICNSPMSNLESLSVTTNHTSLHKRNIFRESLRWLAPNMKNIPIIRGKSSSGQVALLNATNPMLEA